MRSPDQRLLTNDQWSGELYVKPSILGGKSLVCDASIMKLVGIHLRNYMPLIINE